jgi:hypothetical protein
VPRNQVSSLQSLFDPSAARAVRMIGPVDCVLFVLTGPSSDEKTVDRHGSQNYIKTVQRRVAMESCRKDG